MIDLLNALKSVFDDSTELQAIFGTRYNFSLSDPNPTFPFLVVSPVSSSITHSYGNDSNQLYKQSFQFDVFGMEMEDVAEWVSAVAKAYNESEIQVDSGKITNKLQRNYWGPKREGKNKAGDFVWHGSVMFDIWYEEASA